LKYFLFNNLNKNYFLQRKKFIYLKKGKNNLSNKEYEREREKKMKKILIYKY
jgi:hypothetical protein